MGIAKMVDHDFQVMERRFQIVYRRDDDDIAMRPGIHEVQVRKATQERIRTNRTLVHPPRPRTEDDEVIIHCLEQRNSSNEIFKCNITKCPKITQLQENVPNANLTMFQLFW